AKREDWFLYGSSNPRGVRLGIENNRGPPPELGSFAALAQRLVRSQGRRSPHYGRRWLFPAIGGICLFPDRAGVRLLVVEEKCRPQGSRAVRRSQHPGLFRNLPESGLVV